MGFLNYILSNSYVKLNEECYITNKLIFLTDLKPVVNDKVLKTIV